MHTATVFMTRVLAQAPANDGFTGTVGGVDFWDTPLGSFLGTFLGVLGILVVLWSIIRAVKNISTGRVGDAVKGIFGAIIIAAILFQPRLISGAINFGGVIVAKVIDTFSAIGG